MQSTTPKNPRAKRTEQPTPTGFEFGSVVSYPQRYNAWGDSRYRGNCDGRLVLNLIRRYAPRTVADPMQGSGTTRDVVAWLNKKRGGEQIRYWGGDLHEGFDLETTNLPSRYDLVWVHPPYWNIIRYSNDSRDLSTEQNYGKFVRRLRQCLVRCAQALTPNGRLAVLVGDVRRRGGYYSIVCDLLQMEPDLGDLRSILVKLQHNCTSDARTYRLEDAPIRHEYCVVFKRSSRR